MSYLANSLSFVLSNEFIFCLKHVIHFNLNFIAMEGSGVLLLMAFCFMGPPLLVAIIGALASALRKDK